MSAEISRRNVLRGAWEGTALAILMALAREGAPSGKSTPTDRRIGMTNTVYIPEDLVLSNPEHTIQSAINFGAMYDPTKPGNVNLDPLRGGDLWGAGNNVRSAIRKGRKAYLILETPSKESRVSPDDWGLYVASLADRFQGANFVIGNEVNIDPDWKDDPTGFVEYLLTAMEAIKRESPRSMCILEGDAYFGNFEFLENLISVTRRLASEKVVPFDKLIAGVAMHYYDRHNKLPDRVARLAELLKKLGLPPHIFLTEFGKPENLFPISQTEQANILFYNMLVAMALVQAGKVPYVSWFNAYMPEDPRGHNLVLRVFPDQFVPTLGFRLFWNMGELFSGEIWLGQDARGRYVVGGVTKSGRRFSYTLPH